MGKGSSGTKTTYTSSPEQQQMYGALLPMINAMAQQGVAQMGQGNYGMPSAPTAPSMTGVLTGQSMYDIPSTSSMMPSTDWYNSMSPEVKAGVWAPYEEGANALQERLGSIGGLGNQRGGVSGSGAAGLGQYYAQAAPQAAMSLWNMSQPAMQAGWNAQLGQNIMSYQQGQTEAQTNYQNLLNQQQSDYGMQKTAWGLPWALTGMMPSTYSQGITTQPQSPYSGMFGGMLSGGLMGGMVGNSMGGQSGGMYGSGIGGILGGLGGMMG
jgi:hypothetical protein